MMAGTELLAALPVAVYTTDPEGNITFYNDAAAALWGYRPELGSSRWCGSYRLFWPDGRAMAHDECPMAVTLREGRVVSGAEALAERPDGTRVPFIPFPSLLYDGAGQVIGGLNLLIDITDRRAADIQASRLAAIVASSDDAIVSKTLEGRITSWNAGAARIFGFEAEEIVGQPITRIIPPELHSEEMEILAKIRAGKRIDHFDTVRITKDGRRIDVSLTVSPVRDRFGQVVGASKVARDVTERKRSEELQRLLFDELNHRVKNTLATVQALASQSMRRAANPIDFVLSFNGRVQALARAHDVLIKGRMQGADIGALIREQVLLGDMSAAQVTAAGPAVTVDSRAAVQLTLMLHELATNARKYGALSLPTGRLAIRWAVERRDGPELNLEWHESGVPGLRAPTAHGFGTILIERTAKANGGDASVRYGADGVVCNVRFPLSEVGRAAPAAHESAVLPAASSALVGKRVAVIEDEPLVAMEMETHLAEAGCTVVGPAGTIEAAARLIAAGRCDAALLDGNLLGRSVDELAAALTMQGVPFAFVSGYGREALPVAFRDSPLITKPFRPEQLTEMIEALLERADRGPGVVPLRRTLT
jgi:PAS domain S-box-containing protein